MFRRPTPTKPTLLRILATGDGPGHLVRAIFKDCSLDTLDRMAAVAGLSPMDLRTAYETAKRRHAAANAEMDGGV